MSKEKLGVTLMGGLGVLACAVFVMLPPIAQPLEYHNFSDAQTWLGVPHFWNVVSNVPFLVVGLLGLYKLKVARSLQLNKENELACFLFFLGVSLVALGSGYYHLSPDNLTLVWDRLPMTIAFMALVSIIVSEYLSTTWGKRLLFPLLMLGGLSVAYWYYTETQGQGDLRPYALVQFIPMLFMPIILLCFRSRYTNARCYWYLLLGYVAAKLFEHFDVLVYSVLGFMGGHPLKHVAAAVGVYFLLRGYEQRRINDC